MSTDMLHPLNCLCFNVRRAARQITQVYDKALRPAGLTATQFTLLAMVSGKGGEDGLALTALANQLGMDRTTLTRNLALAERHDWLRVDEGKDRRERMISLTKGGQDLLQEAMPLWQATQEQVVQKFGKAELAMMQKLSNRL